MKTLTTSLLMVILVATLGLGWLFDLAYRQLFFTGKNNNIDAVSTLEKMGSELANTLNGLSERHDFIENWSKNSDISLSISQVGRAALPQSLINEIKRGNPVLLESEQHLAFYYYLPAYHEVMKLRSPIENVQQTENIQHYGFTITFYLLLILLFALWLTPLIKQLSQLRRSAKAFGKGDLTQRIVSSKISYIVDIEKEFNQMAQQIENLIADVKLLSSAVSHDLRTPLARLRFGIDTLAEENDPDTRAKYIDKVGKNIDEMTLLVETLLSYARLEQVMLDVIKKPVDLSALVNKCLINKQTSSQNIDLIEKNNLPKVVGDKRYLTMLINNLLQNAINYGDGQITIELAHQQDNIRLSVGDNGQGISEKLKSDIFKPFVRGSHSTIKGHGIGLALVKRITDWHQGHVVIDQEPNLLGARFNILLPINQ